LVSRAYLRGESQGEPDGGSRPTDGLKKGVVMKQGNEKRNCQKRMAHQIRPLSEHSPKEVGAVIVFRKDSRKGSVPLAKTVLRRGRIIRPPREKRSPLTGGEKEGARNQLGKRGNKKVVKDDTDGDTGKN